LEEIQAMSWTIIPPTKVTKDLLVVDVDNNSEEDAANRCQIPDDMGRDGSVHLQETKENVEKGERIEQKKQQDDATLICVLDIDDDSIAERHPQLDDKKSLIAGALENSSPPGFVPATIMPESGTTENLLVDACLVEEESTTINSSRRICSNNYRRNHKNNNLAIPTKAKIVNKKPPKEDSVWTNCFPAFVGSKIFCLTIPFLVLALVVAASLEVVCCRLGESAGSNGTTATVAKLFADPGTNSVSIGGGPTTTTATAKRQLFLDEFFNLEPIETEVSSASASLDEPEITVRTPTTRIFSNDSIVEAFGSSYNSSTTTSIQLEAGGVNESIPTEVGLLTKLTHLDLEQGGIQGRIPSELGLLTLLTLLNMAGNNLTGSIPTELNHLRRLVSLNLTGNGLLTGRIATEYGLFTNLQTLSLSNTNIRARIPSEYGALTTLEELRLANTLVGGTIPTEFERLTSLRIIDFSGSRFRKSIPTFMGLLTGLSKYSFLNTCNPLVGGRT